MKRGRIRLYFEGEERGVDEAAAKSERAIDRVEKSTGRYNVTADKQAVAIEKVNRRNFELVSSSSRVSSEQDLLSKRLQDVNLRFTSLRNVTGLIKWPAIFTGAGYAAQGLGMAAAGATALGGALAPLSGALAAYPALLGGFGQAAGVLALTQLPELKEALAGNEEALKSLTPEAREFIDVFEDFEKPLNRMRRSVQGELFPGLSSGLRDASENLPVVDRLMNRTASTMGGLAERAGSLFGSKGFGRDFEQIGEGNTRMLGRMGVGALRLTSALRHVLVPAQPFLGWLSGSATRFTDWVRGAALAGRESGRLSAFFDRTQSVTERLASTTQSLAAGLFQVGTASAPLGRQILGELDSSAQTFEDWSESMRGRNELREYFADAKPGIWEVGRLLRDAGGAFLRLSTGRGSVLMTRELRTELLPVLEQVIGNTTIAFGPHLVAMLVEVTQLFGHLAGSSGPLTAFVDGLTTGAEAVNFLLERVPGLEGLVVTLAGAVAVSKALKFTAAITGVSSLIALYKDLRTAATGAAVAEGAAASGGMKAQVGGFLGLGSKSGAGGARGFASSFGRALGPALAAIGLGNLISTATEGDMKSAGFQAGGALAGGIAGFFIGGPAGAMIGAGLGVFLGDALSGLFDSEQRLTAFQRRLRAEAQHAARALRGQGDAARDLSRAQDQASQSSRRHENTTHRAKRAHQQYNAAVRAYGPDSQKAREAALRLAHAEEREADAANEARQAHRLVGNELVLYRRRTVEAVASEKQRIPALEKVIANLARKSQRDRDNTQLLERLVGKERALASVKRNLNELYEEAAGKAGPKFSRWLQDMTVTQARFGKRLQGLVRQLPELGDVSERTTDKSTGAFRDWTSVFEKNTRRAGTNVKTFSIGTKSGMKEVEGALSRSLSALGVKSVNFQIEGPDGKARGGGVARVPGQGREDTVGLFLNGALSAVVAPGEDLIVANRHQRPELDFAVANTFGDRGLDGFFDRSSRPHYMAQGGIPRPRLSGTDPMQDMGQSAIDRVHKAAGRYLSKFKGAGLIPNAGPLKQFNHPFPEHTLSETDGKARFSEALVARIASWAGLPGRLFAQVAHGESNFYPGVYGIDPGGTHGLGLWQVTTGFNDARIRKWGGRKQMFNPLKNALAAKEIFDEQGLGAWYGLDFVTGRARGGRLPRFAGGGMVDPGWDPGSETIAGSIAQLVGAFARRYDLEITSGYDPGGGHVSPGHNSTGTATDVVPRSGNWGGAFAGGLALLAKLGFEVGYDGSVAGTEAWPNHGRGNHAHIEWVGNGTAGDARQRLREFLGGVGGTGSSAGGGSKPKPKTGIGNAVGVALPGLKPGKLTPTARALPKSIQAMLRQPGLTAADRLEIGQLAVSQAEETEGSGDDAAAAGFLMPLLQRKAGRIRNRLGDLNKQLRKGGENEKQRRRNLNRRNRLRNQLGEVSGQIRGLKDDQPTARDFADAELARAESTVDRGDDISALQKLVGLAEQDLKRAEKSGDPREIAEATRNLKSAADALRDATPTAEDFATRDLALAELTAGTEDDRAALLKLKDLAQQQLDTALATEDPRDDIEAAQRLKQILDALENTNDILQQREDFEKERLDMDKKLAALAEAQGPAFMAAFAAWIDGAIGGPVQSRARLATAGVSAGYQ